MQEKRSTTREKLLGVTPELLRGEAVHEEADGRVQRQQEVAEVLHHHGPERRVVAADVGGGATWRIPDEVELGHVVQLQKVEDRSRQVADEEDDHDHEQDPGSNGNMFGHDNQLTRDREVLGSIPVMASSRLTGCHSKILNTADTIEGVIAATFPLSPIIQR